MVRYKTSRACQICGFAENTGIHLPIAKGPRAGQPFGHRFVSASEAVTGDTEERTAFERWLSQVHGLTSEWQGERNCYKDFPAHLAYCAWRASRAAGNT